ncbi:MAG: Cytochrome c-type biogenesis protein CcsA/ResC, partial [uncultured Frankineae bacterium]
DGRRPGPAQRPAVRGHRPALRPVDARLRRRAGRPPLAAGRRGHRRGDVAARGGRRPHPGDGRSRWSDGVRPSARAGPARARGAGEPRRRPRPAARGRRGRRARRIGGHPRHGRRPHAVGQHVRVLVHGGPHGRDDLPGAGRDGPGRPRPRGLRHGAGRALPRPRGDGPLHGRGPARPGARLVLDQDPRLRGDPVVRRVPAVRRRRAALPAAGAPRRPARRGRHAALPGVDGRGPAGGAGPGPGVVRRHRLRLPGLDLRDHRRRDLGRGGLGPLLGLGPQGDLVVHHLGAVRRLPARSRDGRVEGHQGGVDRRGRRRGARHRLLRGQHLRRGAALLRLV